MVTDGVAQYALGLPAGLGYLLVVGKLEIDGLDRRSVTAGPDMFRVPEHIPQLDLRTG